VDRAPEGIGRGLAAALLAVPAMAWGCLDPGEPVTDRARVTWAAYPETVLVGETFSMEMAGPVSLNTCGHLDTATVAVGDSTIRLDATRVVYPDAWCSDERVAFYEVRVMEMPRPGRYAVRSGGEARLGTMVVVDSGRFSPVTTVGEGTLGRGGGCLFFGPGWAANQRPFALRGAPEGFRRLAGTDTVVRVRGRLVGFSLCGPFGSRPSIRVDSARATGRTGADWYGPVRELRRDGSGSAEGG
jgi:hypothetical protein